MYKYNNGTKEVSFVNIRGELCSERRKCSIGIRVYDTVLRSSLGIPATKHTHATDETEKDDFAGSLLFVRGSAYLVCLLRSRKYHRGVLYDGCGHTYYGPGTTFVIFFSPSGRTLLYDTFEWPVFFKADGSSRARLVRAANGRENKSFVQVPRRERY